MSANNAFENDGQKQSRYAGRVNLAGRHSLKSSGKRLLKHWRWTVGSVLCVFGLLWMLRGPIADRLWPEAKAEALRRQAESALSQGRLTAPDGRGARELFEAALAIDVDRAELRSGLARVAQAAVQQARASTERGQFDKAREHLRLARALLAPRAQTEAVAEILRRREAAIAGIDRLLSAATAALGEGRLIGDENAALPLYRRVLELQPKRIEALEGREDALAALLQQARTHIQSGDLKRGASMITIAAGYDPGHVELPELQSRLTSAGAEMRRRGDRDLRAGRLQNAVERYHQWQASGANADLVSDAVMGVAQAHIGRAQKALTDFDFKRAHVEIALARQLAPETTELQQIEFALSRAERVRKQRVVQPASRAERRRLQALLHEIEAAVSRGDWLTPPGRSVYDKLQIARSIAPGDPQVRHVSAKLLPRARECFERELRNNRLQGARVCLDARIALEGESKNSMRSRRVLAERWLAIGEERLAAGETQAAESALVAARGLDPKTPRLADFAERVRAATKATISNSEQDR